VRRRLGERRRRAGSRKAEAPVLDRLTQTIRKA
jgi:hypothetical protein